MYTTCIWHIYNIIKQQIKKVNITGTIVIQKQEQRVWTLFNRVQSQFRICSSPKETNSPVVLRPRRRKQ